MEMESSLSHITFKGSIIEAITEAKKQRKLFVVYLSGDDADTSTMERSTWRSLSVTESVSKYCILLHLPADSTNGTQFSAIYPQKSIPSITAVGYNGVQLWQHEGFVDAEVLASSLEKAWLSLHIQETTATVLTAALASKKSEVVSDSTPGTSTSTSSDVRMSPSAALSSSENNLRISEKKLMVVSENVESEQIPEQMVEKNIVIDRESEAVDTNEFKEGKNEASSPKETAKHLPDHDIHVGIPDIARDNNQVPTYDLDGCSANDLGEPRSSAPISMEDVKSEDKRTEAVRDRENEIFTPTQLNKLNDVHLNIRLLNGVSVQEKFPLTSTLQMVKEYIDENHTRDIGSYDLAIPYPRKVFNNQDLNKSLSELGLCNRQALVVVPHQKPTSDGKQGFSSFNPTVSTSLADSAGNKEGYFAFVKRMLSYANPFSYLGGGSSSPNSEQESQSGMWHYRPNSASRSGISDSSYSSPSQSRPESGINDTRRRQPSSSGFGSNIHSLKHDEDDERFNEGNSFWNGNSTQYGGDGEAK